MIPTLWLTGAPGVGKSVTAWRVFTRSTSLGYLDVDQVGMLLPEREEDDGHYALKNTAVSALAGNYGAAGASRLLISGVVDAREPGRASRMDHPDLRYCLLTVDDPTLRLRILERGWDLEDAAEIVREQAALRDLDLTDSAIDTTGRSVSDVASQVAAELAALPRVDGEVAEPADEPRDLADVRPVFVTGPRVVGCSTVGFALARRLWSRGQRTGFADLEQLSFLTPAVGDALTDDRLGLANLATLTSVFAARGARMMVANGHLRDADHVSRLRQHLTGVAVVRLRARPDTLGLHVESRLGGNEARLTGDDLADATAAYQEVVWRQAVHDQQRMDEDGVGDVVLDVDGTAQDDLVEEIVRATDVG